MNRDTRRSVPLLLAGVVAPSLALMACASASPSQPAAQASTQPALTSSRAVIPATVRQVTLSLNYGGNANGRKPPTPVTVTSAPEVSAVAGLAAGQPPWPPGSYSCPAADGMALDLTFRAHSGGPVLATAALALNGCEGTNLTVGAKQYGLGGPDSARALSAKVLKAAGVSWKLPPFQWPPA